MPRFSLVMPVYNRVATLGSALSCVQEQTLRDYELIVVDDGSNDGSLALLEREAALGKLRLLRRASPGLGQHAARNLGAREAAGEWLVFFDADDLLLFDHLSRFADAIQVHPFLELFVNAYQTMEDHQRRPRATAPGSGALSRRQALSAFARGDFLHTNGVCIRRERFIALGGFPEQRYRRGGDAYFWLKALCELDGIHYDATVTSLWLLDHDAPIFDPDDPRAIHPGVDACRECEAELGRCERHYLRAAANREVLSWAIAKRRCGLSVVGDLRALRLRALTPRHLLHVLSLLWPAFGTAGAST